MRYSLPGARGAARRGLALLELLMASVLAAALIGGAFWLTAMAARAERRTSCGAEAAEQAALAREVLAADLARLYVEPANHPIAVSDDGEALAFHALPDVWGQPARPIVWGLDRGRLVRREAGVADRVFALGTGARVAFALVDGVQFRITACSGGAAPGSGTPARADAQALTLVGAAPIVPAPLADFPYWNAQP